MENQMKTTAEECQQFKQRPHLGVRYWTVSLMMALGEPKHLYYQQYYPRYYAVSRPTRTTIIRAPDLETPIILFYPILSLTLTAVLERSYHFFHPRGSKASCRGPRTRPCAESIPDHSCWLFWVLR